MFKIITYYIGICYNINLYILSHKCCFYLAKIRVVIIINTQILMKNLQSKIDFSFLFTRKKSRVVIIDS